MFFIHGPAVLSIPGAREVVVVHVRAHYSDKHGAGPPGGDHDWGAWLRQFRRLNPGKATELSGAAEGFAVEQPVSTSILGKSTREAVRNEQSGEGAVRNITQDLSTDRALDVAGREDCFQADVGRV